MSSCPIKVETMTQADSAPCTGSVHYVSAGMGAATSVFEQALAMPGSALHIGKRLQLTHASGTSEGHAAAGQRPNLSEASASDAHPPQGDVAFDGRRQRFAQQLFKLWEQ